MADPIIKKISELSELLTLAIGDAFPVVDASEEIAANRTKKIFASNLKLFNTAQITDNIITESKIVAGAVTTSKIADSAVTTSKIADSAVTSLKLGAGAVTAGKIATGGVSTAGELAAQVVETAKIKDLNVTTAKLADSAVTTAKIANENVTFAKLAPDSIAALSKSLKGISLYNDFVASIPNDTPSNMGGRTCTVLYNNGLFTRTNMTVTIPAEYNNFIFILTYLASFSGSSSTGAPCYVWIRINDAQYYQSITTGLLSGAGTWIRGSIQMKLTGGNQIAVGVQQNSGSALNLNACSIEISTVA